MTKRGEASHRRCGVVISLKHRIVNIIPHRSAKMTQLVDIFTVGPILKVVPRQPRVVAVGTRTVIVKNARCTEREVTYAFLVHVSERPQDPLHSLARVDFT